MTKEKKIITDDDLYRDSSQFRIWSFRKQELDAKQQAAYLRTHDAMQKSLADLGVQDVEILSFEEHQQLVRFYASKVEEIANVFHMPSQVRVTAVAYFRRFYLENSVMEYHPKNILYTTVFLASKAENHFIPIDKFCQALLRTERKDILDLEFLVLQSLNFTLAVANPLRALHGFFLDIQSTLPDISQAILGSLHDKSRQVVMDSLITNAQFHYTPPQIALAALFHVDREVTGRYMEIKFESIEDTTKTNNSQHLLYLITACAQDMTELNIPTAEIGKQIDKKLYLCLNPRKKKRPTEPESDSLLKRRKTDA